LVRKSDQRPFLSAFLAGTVDSLSRGGRCVEVCPNQAIELWIDDQSDAFRTIQRISALVDVTRLQPFLVERTMKTNFLPIFIVFLLLLAACTTQTETPLPPFPTATQSSGADAQIEAFFSDPDDPNADRYRGGPDEPLAQVIHNAEFSVDAALYDLNLWSIRDALLAVHDAGVQVRIVAESDNLDETEFQDLEQAGIEVLGDRRESLMHNKFVVIDGLDVWTGSMNFTVNGAYRNDNNLIHIRSSHLAENFTVEFEEMFVDDMFGDNAVDKTPNPSLTIDGVLVETSFSPDDGTADQIIQAIQSAEESINFLAFSFTSDPIAEALLRRAADGVTITGVFEESQYNSNTGTEYDNLLAAGLDVRLDGNPNNMHHKVFIIDEETVITGSYNFSQSAEARNDENTLIIHDPEIAAQYLAEFERVFEKAQQP
jgi:phosphatidylserine/phosphatidylglycerophosphate/cardiolipin synthase-like enzyme